MAMICGIDAVRSWGELERDAESMADVLRERGVRPGDRVLFKADNSVGFVTVLLALMRAGTSIVLLDHRERQEETEQIIGQAGVTYCVVDEESLPPRTQVPCTSVYELQLAAATRPRGEQPVAAFDVTDWRFRPDGLVMCSSGSTGVPKLVVKTGDSFLRNLQRNIDQVGHVASDVLVPLLPYPHQYGLSLVLISWMLRCSLVVAPYRRLDHALRMAHLCGGTVFDAAPVTYRSMLNLVKQRPSLGAALSGARMLGVGAAPLDAVLVARYEEEFGHTLLDGYGSTEMGNVTFASLDNPIASGRAVKGVRLAIVGESGAELPPGAVGEIMVRTPDAMSGYLDENGELSPVDQEWFASGDFGYLDENGNLFVLGRKRAVHRMGITLHPDIIERKISELGQPAKLVSLPDERAGCLLVAFVEDAEKRDVAHWREKIAGVLPSFEMPNRIVVIDQMPVNRNGKFDVKRLTEMARSA